MDSLYQEITERFSAEYLPLSFKPFVSHEWRERLMELVSRRSHIYAKIENFRIAGNIRRYQSKFLMREYYRSVEMEREALRAILPEDIASDKVLFASLELAVSFQAWRSLRFDQELSPRETEQAMRLSVERLTAPHSAD